MPYLTSTNAANIFLNALKHVSAVYPYEDAFEVYLRDIDQRDWDFSYFPELYIGTYDSPMAFAVEQFQEYENPDGNDSAEFEDEVQQFLENQLVHQFDLIPFNGMTHVFRR